MKKLLTLIAATLIVPLMAFGVVVGTPQSVSAAACDTTVLGGAQCAKSDEQKGSINVVIKTVTDVLLFIIGAVAVIMIIIGGIRYTISNGDSSQITSAKNTILYGVVGLVVALLAFAIVNFVVSSFSDSGRDGGGGRSAAE